MKANKMLQVWMGQKELLAVAKAIKLDSGRAKALSEEIKETVQLRLGKWLS